MEHDLQSQGAAEAAEEPAELRRFETHLARPNENVLAWMEAEQAGFDGVAVLTEQRLCFLSIAGGPDRFEGISVREPDLRYAPAGDSANMIAVFQCDEETLSFSPRGRRGTADLGVLLGNLKDLRDAQEVLDRLGLPYRSPKADRLTPSAEYRLIRLRELANLGVLSDLDLVLERKMMIQRMQQELDELQ